MPARVVIYVRLLDEGVEVVRPTYGEIVGENIYRLLPSDNYDAENEIWEFPPGAVVRVERRQSPDGQEAFIAVGEYGE